jgi:predicted nuclease with TOPRIM domain
MMQLDEILDDLKTRKTNLTKLKKEISADKTKSGILASITDLVGKIDPLVKETARLDAVRKNIKKFSTDVDTLNGKRKQLINTFSVLKKSCDSVKDDTKAKDFGEISNDSAMYVALNDFEKT